MVNGCRPASLQEALNILAVEPVVPYGGGTDLMVKPDKNAVYLFLNRIPELQQIYIDEDILHIGAGCTFTELIESELTPAILKEAALQAAAPAIRNLATAGGNVCNGSPKADLALIFHAADAKLRLVSNSGDRVIPMTAFYLGRNRTSRQKDELLAEILINTADLDHYYYKKIGGRNALAISRVSFAGIFHAAHGRVTRCAAAFGAVSDVIIRQPEIDEMLTGKTIKEAKDLKAAYLQAYEQAINPVKGRISAEYRKIVCMNLLKDFLDQNGI